MNIIKDNSSNEGKEKKEGEKKSSTQWDSNPLPLDLKSVLQPLPLSVKH